MEVVRSIDWIHGLRDAIVARLEQHAHAAATRSISIDRSRPAIEETPMSTRNTPSPFNAKRTLTANGKTYSYFAL